MSTRRAQIDAMIGSCIDSIASGKNISAAEIDARGYADLLVEVAQQEGLGIKGSIGSPSSVLEAAEELGIISNPSHIKFLKRHELLVHIDSAVRALAHHDKKGFGEIEKSWLGKSFAEKEEMLQHMPQAAGLKAGLLKLRGESARIASLATLENDPANKAKLNRRMEQLTAGINRIHNQFSQLFNQHFARGARKMDLSFAIGRLTRGHMGGRSGRVLRKYAEALRRIALQEARPTRSAVPKARPRPKPMPRQKRIRRRGK